MVGPRFWVASVALMMAGGFAAGCTGEVVAKVVVTPPPPAPAIAASTDDDDDGIANAEDGCPGAKEDGLPPKADDGCPNQDPDGDGVANDKCPEQKETVNGYQDDDGCPDTLPDCYVKDHKVVFAGAFEFGMLHGLQNSSNPTVAGIAQLLKETPSAERIEVAVFLPNNADATKNSALRARRVRDALVKAGVDGARLAPIGYGTRCGEAGFRVELTVLTHSGKPAGSPACGE